MGEATRKVSQYLHKEKLSELLRNARHDPSPFRVIEIEHDNFQDWKAYRERFYKLRNVKNVDGEVSVRQYTFLLH